ncbi:crispr-associated protein [Leptolyngbya sp. Heron Island J]|uniref:TIGR03986 family type III CRISPR-associated RAMP protein n=1 Tax=Leptolyngbya sp. Heron Island J TaxID=1385935 RepID=UPI0003B9D8AD|nr:TIGR03986 family CRISPR-associated RAMP protein [Leptolyngbya sp. Heron Island J]ESA32293.1 crispr-associated protein [Leptolyngbya sp. Heron Island J]
MYPKHISKVSETAQIQREKVGEISISRKAVAAYNFVELPDKVVSAEADVISKPQNQYHSDLHSGCIDCTLTTASPLYIRTGLNLEEFQQEKEAKDLPGFYYTDPDTQKPVLPGSSLRGIMRSLIEIVSFSKFSKVSEQQRFFFRAVAAFNDDPTSSLYKNKLSSKNVKAGYLRHENGQWFIQPARLIGDQTFVRIEDKNINLPGFISMNDPAYKPQYFSNISFSVDEGKKKATELSANPNELDYVGTLVTSGNMKETGDQSSGKTDRKYHYLIQQPDSKPQRLKISDIAIRDYRNSLTTFQKYGSNQKDENTDSPFSEKDGFLKKGRCVFYCEPLEGEDVTLFGQSPNFRIAYSFKESGESASAADFVPEKLKSSDVVEVDIAESIFGYVRNKKTSCSDEQQARAGKVFFSDGICQEENIEDIFMVNKAGEVPRILASPKPTTFQHYLVQTSSEKKKLKHYASMPEKDTVIRGHKLYWHKGEAPDIWHPDSKNASETQITRIRPIKPNKVFTFKIDFENLSSVELGALLWILDVAQQDQYRLSLGMGKPLGMGAVKLTHEVYLCDRAKIEKSQSRYTSLFEDNGGWFSGYSNVLGQSDLDEHTQAFEKHVLRALEQSDKWQKLSQLRRIKMLLTMLEWKETLSEDEENQKRYMEIERDSKESHIIVNSPKPNDAKINEYSERPILPNPLQVAGEVTRPKTFTEGMKLEARVLEKKKKGSKVKYEIFNEHYNEGEKKSFSKIPDEGMVIVEIRSLKEDGSINHVKFVRTIE